MRELPATSAFAADDGSADPRLSAALAVHGTRGEALVEVVTALAAARVLVPVLTEQAPEPVVEQAAGHRAHAAAGIVALRTPDGRTALPVFSSVATMAAWRRDARPMPSEASRAAAAALGEGWEVLVLDPGGPVTVLVPRPAVVALARGELWSPAVQGGAIDGVVRAALLAALSGVAHVVGAEVEPGRRAEVTVVLGLAPGLDRSGLDAVLAAVNAALAADAVVAARVDSLELRVSAAG